MMYPLIKQLITLSFFLCITALAQAQIGYQVTLIDTKTGEPQANKTVQVTVTLSDNAGTNIISQTQSATSDALGVISLSIGNSQTFSNVDWTKLPFWVAASVDGITIGRTQVLNVPVAEYAKRTGQLTIEKLCSKLWQGPIDPDTGKPYNTLKFYSNGTCYYNVREMVYCIDGNFVGVFDLHERNSYTYLYVPERNILLQYGGNSFFE